jgi:hypothetical protein
MGAFLGTTATLLNDQLVSQCGGLLLSCSVALSIRHNQECRRAFACRYSKWLAAAGAAAAAAAAAEVEELLMAVAVRSVLVSKLLPNVRRCPVAPAVAVLLQRVHGQW